MSATSVERVSISLHNFTFFLSFRNWAEISAIRADTGSSLPARFSRFCRFRSSVLSVTRAVICSCNPSRYANSCGMVLIFCEASSRVWASRRFSLVKSSHNAGCTRLVADGCLTMICNSQQYRRYNARKPLSFGAEEKLPLTGATLRVIVGSSIGRFRRRL